MPSFFAGGVEATLFTASLQDSSTNTPLSHARELTRISSLLSSGRPLKERALGVDGSRRGVLRYLGEYEEMPFVMVGCREEFDGRESDEGVPPPVSLPDHDASLSSIDSPLTSLGATPTFGTPRESCNDGRATPDVPPQLLPPSAFVTPRRAGLARPHAHSTSYPDALLNPPREKQSLRLQVKTSPRSHIRTANQTAMEIDLKIEVFMNGDLAGLEFINTKRASMHNVRDFAGTRIHRHVEKPWVYQQVDTSNHPTDAQGRWQSVSQSLAREASIRGATPTGDYLAALSVVPLPEQVAGNGQLGIIDVVVSTGKGSKYGPNEGYVGAIRRMDSRKARSRKPSPHHDSVFEDLPPRKKSRPDPERENAHVEMVDTTETADSRPPDAAAELVQERADMAIDQGGDPNGRLLDWVSGLSPHKPPMRKSPPATWNASRAPSEQRESSIGESGEAQQSGLPEQESKAPAQDVKKTRQLLADGLTGLERLEAFETPAICHGSVVTYDPDPACQRQVARVRPGSFEEEQVVAGMRFVVV